MGTMTNTIEAQAAEITFSSYWYQDSEGHWKIRDGSGNIIRNAWLCDDAVAANGQNVWYLLDANGNMISAGLVQDQTGNYYSLEMNHNGYYGMLRYQSGNYDSINLELENSHSGSFAAIKNQDGIEALKEKYGLTVVNIDNSNCVYTSTFSLTSNKHSNSIAPIENNNSYSEIPDNDIDVNKLTEEDLIGAAPGEFGNEFIDGETGYYDPILGWISNDDLGIDTSGGSGMVHWN